MSFGIFKKKPGFASTVRSATPPAYGSRSVASGGDAPTVRLCVGQRVRGTDVVPDDYQTVNRHFRGVIVDFEVNGKNDVRVKMEGTRRILRVQKKYLQAV